MTTTTSPPLTDEEPGPKQTSTSQVDNHEEVTLPDEEVQNLDQEPDEEETQTAETTASETESSAIFARSKDTGKRSAWKRLKENKPCRDAQG